VASVLLTSPTRVELYVNAGDVVATNPARTAGVKVGTIRGGPTVEQCHARFTRALSEVE
jgi:hypothetical protein